MVNGYLSSVWTAQRMIHPSLQHDIDIVDYWSLLRQIALGKILKTAVWFNHGRNTVWFGQ